VIASTLSRLRRETTLTDSGESNLGNVSAAFAMANGSMQAIKSYVDRGRQLKGLSGAELEELYILRVKEWTPNVFDFAIRSQHSDICAEYSLRGCSPPSAKVAVELNSIYDAVSEAVKAWPPEKREEIGMGIILDYLNVQRYKS
jgi:hypothetical protein